ncbi:hypothetical protein KP509_03G046700 [Ceratopteris richardii]|uniref:Uncharacterized protein n=1 Tax=Ceratopteris richardii TaxID=49495 RepID=A0A8T2V6W6_CERRI|nr:hypothetical protein KP509_03G046700 [Ceratopteris richardii]
MAEKGADVKQLPGVEDAAWLRVIELGSLCCLPMAVKAAIQLNVMEILRRAEETGETPMSAQEIVAHMNVVPATAARTAACLDRILRLLAGHGVLAATLKQDDKGAAPRMVRAYSLDEVSKLLAKNEDGVSLASMVLMNQDKVLMDTWQYLHEAVRDGIEPFTRVHGKDAFSYGQEDGRYDKVFNTAMDHHTKILVKSLLDSYKGFEGVSTLVDVGGGLGTCIRMIVSKYPHIKGINFDQPHVIECAVSHPGIENLGGDMFESIPQADAIFMKWILHDWSDDHCVKILKNCYKALPDKGGKVIVVDAVLPTAVETNTRARVGYHLDVLMLAYNPGGRERTELEFQELCKLSGFTGVRVVSKLNECSVLELYKC